MYGPWRLQSMNVNNDRTAKRAHRSPCDGCAIVVESERAEGLQWLDGSRYYPTRTNRRIDRRLHPTVADVWILTEAESLALLGAL
jgi:hypothetical protein